MNVRNAILGLILGILLVACGSFQTQDLGVGSNSKVESTQQQDQAKGAKVSAEVVDSILTDNSTGIPPYMFIIGGIVFGLIIPQPRFIRWLF